MSLIPKNLIQISREKPDEKHLKLIKKYFPGWNYQHFNDNDIINYFKKTKIDKLPDCEKKFYKIEKDGPSAWKLTFLDIIIYI